MTDQWEKYVELAAAAIDPAAFDPILDNYAGHVRQFRRGKASDLARAALATVGPLIAEDTRKRMVAAAARAVERDVVIEEPAGADAAQPTIIICEPRKDCADPHIYRWHCMRGHDGAAPGVCPLEYCDRKGANR